MVRIHLPPVESRRTTSVPQRGTFTPSSCGLIVNVTPLGSTPIRAAPIGSGVSGVIAGARASSAIEVGSRRMSSITSAAPCSRGRALFPNPQGLPPQKPIAVIPATRPASMGYRRCAARQQSLDHGRGEWSRWRAVCGSWPSACRASQPILGNGSKTLSGPGVISIYR
jgi:hypothetical protein